MSTGATPRDVIRMARLAFDLAAQSVELALALAELDAPAAEAPAVCRHPAGFRLNLESFKSPGKFFCRVCRQYITPVTEDARSEEEFHHAASPDPDR